MPRFLRMNAAAAELNDQSSPYFTKQNAREMQRRATLARKRNRHLRAQIAASQAIQQAGDKPPSHRQLAVADQIARTLAVLETDLEPKERAQLLHALDKLLDRERILAGEPLPGYRKPAPERSARRGSVLPLEVIRTAQLPPAGETTPENSATPSATTTSAD